MSQSIDTSIAKVVRITRLGKVKSDAAYWRTLSYQNRIAALEEIRADYHGWKFDTQPGLQRAYSIVKR